MDTVVVVTGDGNNDNVTQLGVENCSPENGNLRNVSIIDDQDNIKISEVASKVKAMPDFNDSLADSLSSQTQQTPVSVASDETETVSLLPLPFLADTEQFMDSTSLSNSSTVSNNHDSGDDISNYDGIRPSFFIESSRVSMSSDDEDPLPTRLLDLILSDEPDAAMYNYNDWDSGLSTSSNELQGDDTLTWANGPSDMPVLEIGLEYPHRALRHMECQICLEMSYLRRRVCCDYQICNKCLSMYLTGKVRDGKVQIECANDRCNALMYKEEIRHRLSIEMRDKYTKFLVDANKDPLVKTCPSCSLPFAIDPAKLKISKKKLKLGVEVTCGQCRQVWCFRCQAPFHTNMTCKKFRNEDDMVKRWAKERSCGQVNAQKCPKCKIFVQKMDGCDHMKCTQCETNFCYRCGDRYVSVKFFGSHWSRFSLFGCKYRLMPQKTGLRRFIRGSHFVGRVLAATILAGLGVAAGAVLVAGSVVILPSYGLIRLRRRMWEAKQRKKFNKQKMQMISLNEKQRSLEKQINGNLETVLEESETETSEQAPDHQQVQVMVHHPEGAEELLGEDHINWDIFFNKYANDQEDLELTFSRIISHENQNSLTVNYVVREDDHGRTLLDEEVVCEDNGDNVEKEEEQSVRVESSQKISDSRSTNNENTMENDIAQGNSDLCPVQGILNIESETDKGDLNVTKKNDNFVETADNDNSCSDDCFSEVQRRVSLSKERTNINENVSKSKVAKDGDKSFASDKVQGEAPGKGCFGNIFNVAKRTPVVTTSNNANEEDNVKSGRQKMTSLTARKAATWEKCRRSKVEIDPCIKSSMDSVNNCHLLPFVSNKSQSSLSSIIGFSFVGDDIAPKANDDPYVRLEGRNVKLDVDKGDDGGDVEIDLIEEDVGKIRFEIIDGKKKNNKELSCDQEDYISQASAVTHL